MIKYTYIQYYSGSAPINLMQTTHQISYWPRIQTKRSVWIQEITIYAGYSAQTLIHKCIIELLVLVSINAKIRQAVDRLPSGGHRQLGYWLCTSSDCNSPDCCKMQNHFNDMLKQGSPSLWSLRFPCKIFFPVACHSSYAMK